jgi:hypothetical protein
MNPPLYSTSVSTVESNGPNIDISIYINHISNYCRSDSICLSFYLPDNLDLTHSLLIMLSKLGLLLGFLCRISLMKAIASLLRKDGY